MERLEKILNELGDFSRPHKYNWMETDVSQVVEHVAELMEPEINRAGAQLVVSRNGSLPPVMADTDRLSQVLINLINNALQASGEHPKVEVSVEPESEGVLLEVRDQGPGLKPETIREIFTPFFTTKAGGTGLGLPVARRIVEEHGGRIELANRESGGAVARVRLPTAPAIQQKLPLDGVWADIFPDPAGQARPAAGKSSSGARVGPRNKKASRGPRCSAQKRLARGSRCCGARPRQGGAGYISWNTVPSREQRSAPNRRPHTRGRKALRRWSPALQSGRG